MNSSKAGFTGALAARRAKVPRTIFTAHGWAFTEARSAPVRALFKLLQHLTLRFSTHGIAVSRYIAQLAPLWGLAKERITFIPLGIREPQYLSREAAREALSSLDSSLADARNELWVGMVGELHRNKGVDVGAAGWFGAALSDAQFVVIGEGEEKPRLVGMSLHASSIHLLGFVPDASRYMKAFDLVLVPSRTEAFGFVILEAGLAGVPVATSGVGGIKEAVGPDYPGAIPFFTSESSESLAAVLREAVRDRASLARTGALLARHVRATFSFERMVRDTLALYERP